MRRDWIFVAAACVVCPFPAAHALELTTQVDAVVVYQQGASLTRRGVIDVGAGAVELEVVGLPDWLDADSLQVKVSGPGPDALPSTVQMGQVQVDVVQLADAFDADVERLQQDIAGVKQQLQALSDSDATAQLQLTFLKNLTTDFGQQQGAGQGAKGTLDVGAWREALVVLQEGGDAARLKIRDNAQAATSLKKQLSQLERELAQLRGNRPRASTVNIDVVSAQAQQLSVELTYIVPNASWAPRYEARLDSDSGDLRVVQKANVRQWTEESWQDVQLTLATSRPSGELIPPQLPPLVLDFFDPEQRSLGFMADSIEEVAVTGTRAPQDLVNVSAVRAMQAKAAEPQNVTRVSNYAVSYALAGRVDVDNKRDNEHLFDVDEFGATTQLVTRVVPSMSNTAFLEARFTYAEAAPLSADVMAVYVDDTFMGRTRMPRLLPGEEARLPLGRDERLEVDISDQPVKTGERGLLSRTRQETTAKLFSLTSRHTREMVVEVLDRVPNAANNDIEVSVPREATAPTERDVDDRPGVVLWRKTLTPDAVWRIEHRYVVAYPADKSLARY